jgi:hypothetical protein
MIVVTPGGAVGPLRVNKSTRADVIAFAGKPDAATRFSATYDALGFGCSSKEAARRSGLPRCRTIYFVGAQAGTFAELYTEDPSYAGPRGVRVGMRAATAAKLLHRPLPWLGCQEQLFLRTPAAYLAIVLQGRKVSYMVLVAQKHLVGAFDCVDRS